MSAKTGQQAQDPRTTPFVVWRANLLTYLQHRNTSNPIMIYVNTPSRKTTCSVHVDGMPARVRLTHLSWRDAGLVVDLALRAVEQRYTADTFRRLMTILDKNEGGIVVEKHPGQAAKVWLAPHDGERSLVTFP